jgi:hypothetical protein
MQSAEHQRSQAITDTNPIARHPDLRSRYRLGADERKDKKMTPEQIQEILAQQTGTTAYYRHFSGIRYTDGVRIMGELCKAYPKCFVPVLQVHQGQREHEFLEFWVDCDLHGCAVVVPFGSGFQSGDIP